MIRQSRFLLLLMFLTTVGLAWPSDVSAQRRPPSAPRTAAFHRRDRRVDPLGPPVGQARVLRGGSHLCHDSYCFRYRTSARMGNTPDSTSGNTGFRCAR